MHAKCLLLPIPCSLRDCSPPGGHRAVGRHQDEIGTGPFPPTPGRPYCYREKGAAAEGGSPKGTRGSSGLCREGPLNRTACYRQAGRQGGRSLYFASQRGWRPEKGAAAAAADGGLREGGGGEKRSTFGTRGTQSLSAIERERELYGTTKYHVACSY